MNVMSRPCVCSTLVHLRFPAHDVCCVGTPTREDTSNRRATLGDRPAWTSKTKCQFLARALLPRGSADRSPSLDAPQSNYGYVKERAEHLEGEESGNWYVAIKH